MIFSVGLFGVRTVVDTFFVGRCPRRVRSGGESGTRFSLVGSLSLRLQTGDDKNGFTRSFLKFGGVLIIDSMQQENLKI